MADWNLPWEGGCRCGAIRLRITKPPMITMACHCAGCQKMSSSAYSLSAAIPSDGFEVTKGEPVLGGLKGPDANHYFCPDCMTWMFTRPRGMDWFVNLRPTMLDDPSWFEPFAETYLSEKLPFVQPLTEHGYDRFPPMEDFEPMMKAFAARHDG